MVVSAYFSGELLVFGACGACGDSGGAVMGAKMAIPRGVRCLCSQVKRFVRSLGLRWKIMLSAIRTSTGLWWFWVSSCADGDVFLVVVTDESRHEGCT